MHTIDRTNIDPDKLGQPVDFENRVVERLRQVVRWVAVVVALDMRKDMSSSAYWGSFEGATYWG